MRDDRLRLADILDAISRIEAKASRGRDAFDQDEMLQVWVVHHLQLIGEACRSLSEALRNANPRVPWAQIIAMRHILVHDYFGINLDLVWTAVEHDLPSLKEQVRAILDALATGPGRSGPDSKDHKNG